MKTLGFIGAGRMATALATGCIKAGLVPAPGVLASDPVAEARHKFAAAAPGARLVDSNGGVLADADTVILAVKPQMMSRVLGDIRQHAQPRHLFVSIAAGVTLARLAEGLPSGARLIRVMPNTPCLVGLGASCYSRGATATPDDAESVRRLLTSVGQAFEVEESQLDAVTGLSGSGPAFVYTVIEALAQGAIAQGLAADLALNLAAQTAAGAAAMVQQTGLTPAELRDQVASPGGTTVAGLEALGRRDAAGALQAAVEAATRRSRELGKT